MKKLIAAICASSMMMLPGLATAKTATTTIPVQAQVVGNCTLGGTPSLNFLTYDGSQNNVSTSLTITCTGSKNVLVDVSSTSGSAGAYKMTSTTLATAETLNYSIFTSDPATGGAQVWASAQSIPVTKGTAATVNIYGQIPSGQTPSDDIYKDTLTVTVTY